jgi:hypothetical protein
MSSFTVVLVVVDADDNVDAELFRFLSRLVVFFNMSVFIFRILVKLMAVQANGIRYFPLNEAKKVS